MKITKQQINYLLGIGLLIMVIAVLYAINAYKMAQVDKMLEGAELPNGLLEEQVSYNGEKYLVPPTDIYDAGSILPAITEPTFVDVATADSYLADDVAGIDIEVMGSHRFYSYQIINWHEVVNDQFGVEQLLITHCALCNSSAVYSRIIDGDITEFKNSGKIYNNNQIIESDDGTYYLQLSGTAISGKQIGTNLEEIPFEVMTWAQWKERYPNGEVLSTNTGYVRDYGMHPYQNYDIAKIIYYPMNLESEFLGSKWDIEGLSIGDDAIAFSDKIMEGKYVANEVVGETLVVGFWQSYLGKTFVFSPVVNEQTLTFSFNTSTQTMTDDQTGSKWNSAGTAISGELAGSVLQPIQTKPSFWMCWYAQYPQTKIAWIDITNEESAVIKEEDTVIEIDAGQIE